MRFLKTAYKKPCKNNNTSHDKRLSAGFSWGVFIYTHTEIRQLMAKLKPIAMRLEVKQGIRGNMLINDSYNNDLLSLTIALDFLDWQAEANKLSRTVLLSDIMQSGLREQELYQQIRKRNLH